MAVKEDKIVELQLALGDLLREQDVPNEAKEILVLTIENFQLLYGNMAKNVVEAEGKIVEVNFEEKMFGVVDFKVNHKSLKEAIDHNQTDRYQLIQRLEEGEFEVQIWSIFDDGSQDKIVKRGLNLNVKKDQDSAVCALWLNEDGETVHLTPWQFVNIERPSDEFNTYLESFSLTKMKEMLSSVDKTTSWREKKEKKE